MILSIHEGKTNRANPLWCPNWSWCGR